MGLICQHLEISFASASNNTYSALNIHPDAKGFVIGSGAILGICAGLLWTAQGSLMMAYPTEGQKGVFVGVFWAIFNLGGVVGSSVALGENIGSEVRVYVSFGETKILMYLIARLTRVSYVRKVVS